MGDLLPRKFITPSDDSGSASYCNTYSSSLVSKDIWKEGWCTLQHCEMVFQPRMPPHVCLVPMILSAILVHLSQKEMDWKQNSKVSQEKAVMKNTSKPSFYQHLIVTFLTVRFWARNLIFIKHRMKSLDLSFIYLIHLQRSETTFQDCSNNWSNETWARSGDTQSSRMASSFGLRLLHWIKSCSIQ